ncbi:MAG: 2Fe-2S iron-sulfur cluster-binding protein, partial [Dehalococcoidia bacterium]|nr:2Fe-2S iron-sulfur cluster-binding protein [Dehalococcoidia bacterium]
MNPVTLEINGKAVSSREGLTVLEAASDAGITIPTLCYHEALTPYGGCRLCTVEVTNRGRSRLVTACTYPVEEGLVVTTDSPAVHRIRMMIVELLLARCPNVPMLQSLAKDYGIEKPRLKKIKDDDCILCGLCVRMCAERMGANAISFVGRGVNRGIDTPFHVQSEVCRTCGACAFICPTGAIKLEDISKNTPIPITSEFDMGLGGRAPVYIPYPQAIPNVPIIDKNNCIHFLTGECEVCQTVCKVGAINYEQQDEDIEIDVGSIILAPGYEPFDATIKPQYGYGRMPNVVTSIQFERILSASGPLQGQVLRPSDGKHPVKIAWIQCVGSRDETCGRDYCSSVCCMYAIKQSIIAKEHASEIEPTIFFMDIRAHGKGFERYYERAQKEHGVRFIRTRV